MANIIITNISTLSNDPKLWQYSSDLGIIDGVNTNEAPVKYLIRYIAKNNQKIDKIIAVTTNEAEPALDALKASLKCFPISTPEPFMIKFKENKFAETIREVSNEFNSGDHVFIDTTGGFRNSSYFLMCVARILEYSGTDLIKAVYSKFEKDNPDNNRIIDVTDLYNMYDLINAVDAFTNYGNSHGLEQYFKDTDEPAVKEVISAMNAFSDMISLCRTSELSGILSKLNSSLDKLSKTDTDKADIILLKTLIPAVREKFYMKNKRIEYPDIVRWCLDNRFIQQAVTIYVERMPEYFFSKNYITISDKMSDKIKTEKANSHFDINYEMFYNYFAGQDNKKTRDFSLPSDCRKSRILTGRRGRRPYRWQFCVLQIQTVFARKQRCLSTISRQGFSLPYFFYTLYNCFGNIYFCASCALISERRIFPLPTVLGRLSLNSTTLGYL